MQKKARQGFTLTEIMIVVAIIGILVGIAAPNLVHARLQAQGKACAENLYKIDGAKQQWAIENNQGVTGNPSWTDLVNTTNVELSYLKKQPGCPGGGSYTLGSLNTDPSCSVANTSNLHRIP